MVLKMGRMLGLVFVGMILVSPTNAFAAETDHLVVIDAQNDYTFKLSITAIQKFDFDPGTKLTVFSTSHNKLLLSRISFNGNDNDWKSVLASQKFESPNRLDLPQLNNIVNGHFNNDGKDHDISEIVTLMTGYTCICGDLSFIDVIRKKKMFIVAVGYKKSELCPVFTRLAADTDHEMEIRNGSDIDPFIEEYRIRYFKDKGHTCDTDKFIPPGLNLCASGDCSRPCFTKIVQHTGYCMSICPYFKSKKDNALVPHQSCDALQPRADASWAEEKTPDGAKNIRLVVGLSLGGVAALLIVCLCYWKRKFLVESVKACYKNRCQAVPQDEEDTEAAAEEDGEEDGDGEEEEEGEGEREEEEEEEEEEARPLINGENAEDGGGVQEVGGLEEVVVHPNTDRQPNRDTDNEIGDDVVNDDDDDDEPDSGDDDEEGEGEDHDENTGGRGLDDQIDDLGNLPKRIQQNVETLDGPMNRVHAY